MLYPTFLKHPFSSAPSFLLFRRLSNAPVRFVSPFGDSDSFRTGAV
jgi:hypothetical protein